MQCRYSRCSSVSYPLELECGSATQQPVQCLFHALCSKGTAAQSQTYSSQLVLTALRAGKTRGTAQALRLLDVRPFSKTAISMLLLFRPETL